MAPYPSLTTTSSKAFRGEYSHMSPKKTASLKRKNGRLEQRSRFLICTEGRVSEKIYVNGFKGDLGRSGPSIEIGRTHGEPLGLVRSAIVQKERERKLGDPFDQVWCIFDVEVPEPHASFNEAVELARRENIRCGITNPCFELWLILHFEECHAWLTTDQACTHLVGLPCGYDKDTKSFDYSRCRGLEVNADARADALDASYERAVPIRDRNPWASIQDLFRELREACSPLPTK